MRLETPSFVHDYTPGVVHYGREVVADLDEALADRDLERAVVVCGKNVGANRDVMDPVEAGLGDRLAAVFDETTPEKRIETAYDGVEVMRAVDADALVPVGAGSSLDVAKAISVLYGDYQPLDALLTEIEERGYPTVTSETEKLTPSFPIPTTFAGADLSTVAGFSIPGGDGDRKASGLGNLALMPTALFYDPAIFATTPRDVLAGSAFNGFDKAVEAIYSQYANPITDATAVHALRYLRDALPRLGESPDVMDRAVIGIVLAQYGLAARGATKTSVIHAFGHGLREVWDVHQGVAHAVMAPHVLELLFDRVDARRELLAEGLGVSEADDPAAAVVATVDDIRAALDLPARLRDVEGTDETTIPEVASATHADSYLRRGPVDFDPSVEAVEAAVRAAW